MPYSICPETVNSHLDLVDQAHLVEAQRRPGGDATRVFDGIKCPTDLRQNIRHGSTRPLTEVVEYGAGSGEPSLRWNSSPTVAS